MKEINNIEDVQAFCRALGAPVRMKIVNLLIQNRCLNLNDLAERLGVTNGAITSHVKKLYDEGIIEIEHTPGKRGVQKNCYLKQHKFMIDLSPEYSPINSYEIALPIGSYIKYNVLPTCGIATMEKIIGNVDDPRYFDDPKRHEAAILWFTEGFVEYRIPNYLKPGRKVTEIQISMEISSEAPGFCENWPSDIHFSLNEVFIGNWVSPGDFGRVKGLYTPNWWFPNWNQYGFLKLISVNQEGTFLDGKKISEVTMDALHLEESSTIDFQLAVTEKSKQIGGLTLFGKGFGNYNQDINVRVIFT